MEKVALNDIVEAMQRMKLGKATGSTKVSVEMIVASGKIEVKGVDGTVPACIGW